MPHRGPRYLSFQLDLTAARVNERFDIEGGLLMAIKSSAAGALITVRFNSPTEDAIEFQSGDEMRGRFRTLYITNTAQAGVSIDLLITEGPDDFRYIQAVAISSITSIDTLTTIVDPVTIAGEIDVDIIKSGNQFDQVGHDFNSVNNPASGTILAESGDLPAGLYAFELYLGAESGTPPKIIKIFWRDSADVTKGLFYTSVHDTITFGMRIHITMALNDDLKVSNSGSATGQLSAWMSWRRYKT